MKKSIPSLFAVAAVAFSALTAHAQTAPKILVVDLAKLFESHWKTREQQAKLQADATKAQDKLTQLQKDGSALVAQFKELDEQSKNPTVTADAKGKIQVEAQKMYEEIQKKHTEMNTFAQNAQNALQQRSEAFKTLMFEEISKAAIEVAKRKSATFLLDKSGPTMVGVSNILYYDPSLEITDEVMVEINKNRPAGAPTSGATAPEGNDAPKITVPGVAPSK